MTTTISLSYSYLSASPIEAAYLWIDWNSPIVFLSNPERSLVQQAEENPLEYTLASSKDAFDYIRVLLKVLDQVTGPCDDANDHLALESPTKDAAEQYYLTHKTGVVTHYILQQLYSVVLILMENHYDPSGNNHNNNKKPTVATMFYNAQTGALLEDWRPLLRLLYQLSGDAFAQRNASLCLAYILLQAPPTMTTTANASKNEQQETIQSLIRWLTERLQESSSMSYSSKRKNINNHHNPSSSSIHVVTPTLMVLCTHPTARNDLASAGGIGYICRHLVQPSTTVQQQYELVFCLWTMTLDLNDHDHDHDTTNGEGASPQKSTAFLAKQFHRFAIPALCGLVKSAPREKITRLALASLCQLCTTKQQDFLRPIMGCGVYTSLERLKERQWTDPDAVEGMYVFAEVLYCMMECMKQSISNNHTNRGKTKWPFHSFLSLTHNFPFLRFFLDRLCII